MAKSKKNGLKRRAARNGKLTPKERAFAAAYVADPSRNATQAAKAAGYGAPAGAGWRCLNRPGVKAKIAELEAAARKLVKVKKVEVSEVIPPPMRSGAHALHRDAQMGDEHAIASRAEALAVATNTLRGAAVLGEKKVSDLYDVQSGTLVTNAKAVADLPMSAIKSTKHDHAGDLEVKYADPLPAAKVILDDHHRAREGEGASDLAAAWLEVLRGAIEGQVQGELAE